MRLWSLHPRYLDPKGLVAVWREGFLALSVLEGKTAGYRYHPQLDRFKAGKNPADSLRCYLWHIFLESKSRGYKFDSTKVGEIGKCKKLRVTTGQLTYELQHLKMKLKDRNPDGLKLLAAVRMPQPHPLFRIVPGGIEDWERVKKE